MSERLQKVLAERGVASRRRSDELIAAGRVRVNGVVAEVGHRVEPGDDIVVDGEPIQRGVSRVYLALNKPPEVVTTARGRAGERTVFSLLPDIQGLHPVGRLDKDTSGLLLFSNDGEWSNLVMHPRYRVEKEYDLRVRGRAGIDTLVTLRGGVEIEPGVVTAPARVELLSAGESETRLSVTVMEGKKRQIRLMAAAVGHPVLALRRVRVGAIRLGNLGEGRWRQLREEEVEGIREHARRATGDGAPAWASDRHRRSGGRREVDGGKGRGRRT